MRHRTNLKIWVAVCASLLAMAQVLPGRTITVDDDGPADFSTIQAAVDSANDSDEIIVRPGLYTGEGNRDIDFGGRKITVKSTNGPENCIIDCEASSSNMHRGFYFHSGEGQASMLDGFTITNGYALNDEGGGIFCVGTSPTITNCIISDCKAGDIVPGVFDNGGGGMSNIDGSGPTLANCTFSGNSAQYGAGLYNRDSRPTLINCTFSNNSARYGGAIFNRDGNSTVTNCTFIQNSAFYAGAIYINANSSLNLTDCTFRANWGESQGGAVMNYGIAALTNCTFSENSAGFNAGAMNDRGRSTVTKCIFVRNSTTNINGQGGGMSCFRSNSTLANCLFVANSAPFYGGGLLSGKSTVNLANCTFAKNSVGRHGRAVGCYSIPIIHSNIQITNCILWDGGDEVYNEDGSTITITYSDVQGGMSGEGNKNVNPSFVNPWNDDYHLRGYSLCINAGSPGHPVDVNESDIDGQPRIIGGRVDIGADEFHGNNARPIADAGQDQIAYARFDWLAGVILDGSGSYDDDGHVLTYLWSWTIDVNNFSAIGRSPRIKLPGGEHLVELVVNDRVEDSEPDEVIITVVPPVQAGMKFTPQALNPASKGNWMKAHFVLPEGYAVGDVDANRPAVVEPGGIESDYLNVFVNDDGLVEIEAAFGRAEFCTIVTDGEPMEVTVVGSLTSGQQFYGTDTIKITTNYLKYLGTLASHWLQAGCGKPDWCSGLDLDQDSAVDFEDYALFDGCCVEVVGE